MKNPRKVKAHLSYGGVEVQIPVKLTTGKKSKLQSDQKFLGKVVSRLKLSYVSPLTPGQHSEHFTKYHADQDFYFHFTD